MATSSQGLIFYCRGGFESDLANEVQEKTSLLGVYGYPKFTSQSGFIQFVTSQAEDGQKLIGELNFNQLIFARQMFCCVAQIDITDPSDRISPLLEQLESLPFCGELRVEYPDTTEGRELSKFCRKFAVPLRQALRKKEVLSNKPLAKKPVLHVFFPSNDKALMGYSLASNNSPNSLGILRLKFPAQAPSRSTLKLDEAFQLFIPKAQREIRTRPGVQAVDLGACPGGWTYQLVQRGMFVQAVDNGAMDSALMETGQVQYFAEDGFKYQPKKKQVYWLVCDMIEQPQRVARLMASWVAKGWCKEAIFNLKLPMKRRYESVCESFEAIDKVLAGQDYFIQAKHLYHDREEITVHLCLKSVFKQVSG